MTTSKLVTRLLLAAGMVIGTIGILFHVVGGLPGSPQSRASSDGLKTKQDLHREMGDLVGSAYDIFGRAVSLQSAKQYGAAQKQYLLLRNVRTIDGATKDLWVESHTVAHNLSRLESSMR